MRNLRGLLFLFTHWNWKAALIAGIIRGVVCMAALRHMNLDARQYFGLVEALYVLATSGFASALQQQSLGVKNRRTGWFLCVVVIPFASLFVDSAAHLWLNGVSGKQIGIAAITFTLVSAMFHWHVMSHGAMVVGKESKSLASDMKQMPKLVALFVAEPVMKAWKAGNALLVRDWPSRRTRLAAQEFSS
jgi:hypothetical protein